MAEMQVKSTRQYVEELLERDFLEHVSWFLSLEHVMVSSLPWWVLPIDYIQDQFEVSWLNPHHHVTSLGLSRELMTVDLSNVDCYIHCWAVSLRWPSHKRHPRITLDNLDLFL
jgi:hypothetical protein